MANLYEITEDMMRLMDMMNDPDTDNEALEEAMQEVQANFEEKAESYCQVIKQFEADAAAYNAEADRLKQRQTVCENNVKRLKEALQKALVATGHEKGFNAGLFRLKVSNNGGVRPIVIDGEVPAEYKIVKYENNNEAIRKYLEGFADDKGCSFAHFGERGTHLSIR